MFLYIIFLISFLYVSALIAFIWYLTKCVEHRRRNAGRQVEFETRFRAIVADQQKSCKPSRSRNSKRSCDENGDAWILDLSPPEYKRAKIEEFEDTRKSSMSQSRDSFTITMDKPSLSFPEVFQQENVLIITIPNEGAGGDHDQRVVSDGEKEPGQIQPKLKNGNPKDVADTDDPYTIAYIAQRSDDGQPGACGDCLENIPS